MQRPAIPEALHTHGTPDVTWARRRFHRRAGIRAIQGTRLYRDACRLAHIRVWGLDEYLHGPDPEDESVSKRTWEASVMLWRQILSDVIRIYGS